MVLVSDDFKRILGNLGGDAIAVKAPGRWTLQGGFGRFLAGGRTCGQAWKVLDWFEVGANVV